MLLEKKRIVHNWLKKPPAVCYLRIRLETKSCRILPLTYGTKYDMT